MKQFNVTITMTDKTEESLLKQFPQKDFIEILQELFVEKVADVEVKPIEKPSTVLRNFMNGALGND